MSFVKIGVQTRCFRLPLRRSLQATADLGATGVELDLRNELPREEFSRTAVREFRKLLGDLGLEFAAATFPTQRELPDAELLERRVQAISQGMSLAHDLGARMLVCRPGRIHSDDSARRVRQVQALTALAVQGERVGARLVLHSAGESPNALAELLAELPAGLVGVALHPGEQLRGGHDPRAALEQFGPQIELLYATDAVQDLGSRQVVEVELGRGVAEIPELLGALSEFHYRGWAVVERLNSPQPREDIANAVAFLRAV